MIDRKIIEYKELADALTNFKNKKIVLAGGCFDLLHYGHYCFLKQAKKLGEILVVALESDEFILKKKNRKPLHDQNQRAEILAGNEFVDLIVKLPYFEKDTDYFDMVRSIKPKFIAVTAGDPQLDNKSQQALMVGGEVREVVPLINNLSTTNILNGTYIPGN